MFQATFPVPFVALAAASVTTANYLTDDLDFCAELVGPDREATISAFTKFSGLLTKAQAIEPRGYRPMVSSQHLVGAELAHTLAHTINSMFGSAIAAVHALESAEPTDINMERFVGGVLAMAREIPKLEREIDLLIAQQQLAQNSTSNLHAQVVVGSGGVGKRKKGGRVGA